MNIFRQLTLPQDEDENENNFIPMISDEDEPCLAQTDLPDTLPILPLRNMVLFPGVAMPVSIGRAKSLSLVREAYRQSTIIATFTQKDASVEDPRQEDLAPVGVVARIIRILEMPDNSTTIILQTINRCELDELTSVEPYLKGRIVLREDIVPQKTSRKFEALIQAIKDLSIKIIKNSASNLPPEAVFAIRNIEKPFALVNFICANFAIKMQEKLELLMIDDFKTRCYRLLEIMNRESQLLDLKMSIQSKTKEGISQQQREFFLQQQIKTIQNELGGTAQEQECREMRQKAKNKHWSQETAESFEKEMLKLEAMSPYSPDYSTQANYLHTLLDLPWGEYSKDNFNLARAKKVLNQDHFGMEKVKERILEHLAVLKLKKDLKAPILCLYGPPGVGKTSLGRSIAEALGRQYQRISLGGLHDEAEIRGHRRTYIGAMPGRIIKGLMKAGTSNPVFILDEIDKVTRDAAHGDPSFALLEVLDPEQNFSFHDNFIDLDYDLSKVMFIATANSLNNIPQPLLDRMELIDVSGYICEEKVEIAWRHLLPKQLENHGLKPEQIKLDKADLPYIIESYTRESGVRELDKKIAQLCRHCAHLIASHKETCVVLDRARIKEFLGVERYKQEHYEGNDNIGVVTGLAWTAAGGEILYIESSINPSKNGGKLSLTGNLGDVMKESAILALEYLKAHYQSLNLGLDSSVFDDYNVHIHVPEGAVPKDGPSAGITLLTSIVSSFSQRKVRKDIAMTGEMTLRGRVMPVGGIKEKILAAKRSGIKEIILSEENRQDIEEIQAIYRKGLVFHYVHDARQVIELAIETASK